MTVDSWDLVFLCSWPVSFHGGSLAERPLGGSESAVIEVARRFAAKGRRTAVFCPVDGGREGLYDGVDYRDYVAMEAALARGEVDVDTLVVFRDPTKVALGARARRTLLWIEDMPMAGLRKQHRAAASDLDRIIAVSACQRDRFLERFDLSPALFHVSRNGVDRARYHPWPAPETRGKRLLYCSTPFRGLRVLLDAFPAIRARHPDATLELYSGMTVYDQSDAPFADLYERARALPGVTLHDPVPQQALIGALQQAQLLVYPSVFDETSCIAVLMAIAAGAVPVTSPRAALPETVGDCGLLVPGDAKTDADYARRYAEAVSALLAAPTRLARLRERCRERDVDWASALEDWPV